jgi:hypothetical protein
MLNRVCGLLVVVVTACGGNVVDIQQDDMISIGGMGGSLPDGGASGSGGLAGDDGGFENDSCTPRPKEEVCKDVLCGATANCNEVVFCGGCSKNEICFTYMFETSCCTPKKCAYGKDCGKFQSKETCGLGLDCGSCPSGMVCNDEHMCQ